MVKKMKQLPHLKLRLQSRYKGGAASDPIKYYFWPILGELYRWRVELCLSHCRGGQSVLEIGFGSGISFMSLASWGNNAG
jgi:hypothetical protein